MNKAKEFIKKHIADIIEIVLLAVFLVLLGIIFFSYNINMTWDSSEYIGLASFIGTDELQTNWIGHRGIAFPWIIRLSQSFGSTPIEGMLILMFVFFATMVISFYFMYRKLKQLEITKSIISKIAILGFYGYVLIFIILNPMIFGYFHTVLTEFVAFTMVSLVSILAWYWADFKWEENKILSIISSIILIISTIFIYHIKQSLVVFTLIPILAFAVLSIINDFSYKNIVSKLLTLYFLVISLLYSTKVWGCFMLGTTVGAIYYVKIIGLTIAVIEIVVVGGYYLNKLFNKHKKGVIISSILVFILIVCACIFTYSLIYNHYHEEYEYKEYVSDEKLITPEGSFEVATGKKTTAGEDEKVDANQATYDKRLKNRLIRGSLTHTGVYTYNFLTYSAKEKPVRVNNQYVMQKTTPKIDRDFISVQDNKRIDDILTGRVEKEYFEVYKSNYTDKYIIYFYKEKNTFKDQLDFYIKVLINYPNEIVYAYNKNYRKIILVNENRDELSPYQRENFNITHRIYRPHEINIVDLNFEYEKYIEEYKAFNEENLFFSSKLNEYMLKAIHVIIFKMETALLNAPKMLVLMTALYVFFKIFKNDYMNKNRMSLLQFIIVLYATTFGGVLSYVAMGTTVDRYAIPASVTAFLAYGLVAIFVFDLVIYIFSKIIVLIKKNMSKKTIDNKAKQV